MDTHEELEDRKGVIRGRTPKNDRQKENEDTKGVLRGRTPKKDIQEELEDTPVVIRQKEFNTHCVSSSSSCVSCFGVGPKITLFAY
jgi:hypothetical protein